MVRFEDVATRTMKRDFARVVFTGGVLLYVLRVIGAVWRTDLAPFFPDSFSYVDVAHIGPFHPEFWFSERPVGAPLLLWLCGTNLRAFFLVQTLVFASSVAVLGRAVLEVIRSRFIGWLTVAAITAVAVQPRFGLWHLEALSESLGSSVGILTFALWLRAGATPSRRGILLASLATAAWMLTRDVHALLALVVIVGLVVVSRLKTTGADIGRTMIRSAIALVLVVLYVVTSQAVSDRNQYPLMNNIGLRILPDSAMTDSFAAHGMPLGEALAARSGRDTWDDESAFLTSPDLASFRQWVQGRGQIAQMSSLVTDAGFWFDETADVLPSAFSYDFAEYDRFGTSQRLPDRLFWFDGLRTGSAAIVLTALAGFGLLGLAVLTRRWALITVLAAAGTIGTLDFYVSASSDAVEVLRHLIGPVLRLHLVGFVVIGLALDAAWAKLTPRRDLLRARGRVPVRRSTALAIAAGTIGLFVAWVALENRTQDFDPQYTRTIVERAAAFGGTYYQNGIHNKGPLETAVYDSVRWFTSADGYWFGISVYVILAALVIGAAVWFAARSNGASRTFAAAASCLVVIHFTISTSDYAGVLYSRNITAALLAATFALTIWPRPWSNRRWATISFIVGGIAIGLAVQTLLTTVFAGAVLAIFLIVERARSTSLRRPVRTLAITIVSTVASAPAWYVLRASFDEFWSGWWIYARFMSSGTGRSLLDQLGLGLTKFLGYYQDRPVTLAAIASFALFTWIDWKSLTSARRRVHVVVSAWFVAAWIELVLAQRYSSHYFSVIAVPTAVMATLAAISATNILYERRRIASPARTSVSFRPALAMSCVLILMQGTDILWAGVEGASRFRSISAYSADQREFRSGATRTTRAVLDLVSTRGDALLAWTMYPWTYLDHQRVPATRFIWKSFLIGEIYLGRTSPTYVLPRTTTWFAEDLAESRPTTYLRPVETMLVEGTPMDSVLESFDQVYLGPDVEIRFERDVWAAVLTPGEPVDLRGSQSPLAPSEPSDTGWVLDVSDGTQANLEATMATAPLPLLSAQHSGTCWRVDATVQRPDTETDSSLQFDFHAANRSTDAHSDDVVHLGLDFARAWSGDVSTRYLEQALEYSDAPTLELTVLIGPQSAALIVDGRIVAAVSLKGASDLAIQSLSPTLNLADLRFSRTDSLYGC